LIGLHELLEYWNTGMLGLWGGIISIFSSDKTYIFIFLKIGWYPLNPLFQYSIIP